MGRCNAMFHHPTIVQLWAQMYIPVAKHERSKIGNTEGTTSFEM